jgi:hypothetical protein
VSDPHGEWTEARLTKLISDLPHEKREADPGFTPSEFFVDEVLAFPTPDGVEICVPTIEWHSQLPLPTHKRRRLITWDELDKSDEDNENFLRAELAAVRKKRIQSYRRCQYCKKVMAPESMFDKKVCQGCAQEHLGVVF